MDVQDNQQRGQDIEGQALKKDKIGFSIARFQPQTVQDNKERNGNPERTKGNHCNQPWHGPVPRGYRIRGGERLGSLILVVIVVLVFGDSVFFGFLLRWQ